MYALLSTEWNVDEVTDMMLFKGHQEVQADPERHMSFDDTPRDPAVRTTESFDQDTENPDAPFKVKKGAQLMAAVCCFNRTEIKADVAQYPRKWKMGFPCGSYDSRRPGMKDVVFRAGELGIQVEMIVGGYVAITKETCRDNGMGTPSLTTKDISVNEADMLGVRFGEVVEGCLGCRSTSRTEVSDCSGSEEVISRRDHSARNLSGTLALNEFSSTAWEVPRPTDSGTQGKF